ncbi:outer envelope pore protein 37, chloroplastic [Rhododendron vialii]|uniref:outer envelope pore protein 37, chloroplastic n=1 Tax=Rhododendron vialii TaxID=182163 RepID=UPI00265EB6EE|nr:outer envelope pore protein 37, chloroplastic [Rhododendron vialii]
MAESVQPNPSTSLVPTATAGDPPPPAPPPPTRAGGFLSRRPGIRVTTEFDSDSAVFFHKISCKFLDSLAKLKVSFQNNDKGEVFEPQLALTSKYLSLHYDLEERNALVKSSFDVGPGLEFRASHDVKAQQGEVTMVADLAGPAYKFELSSAVPSVGLPKATFKFPIGEVSLEEKEEEEVKKMLSINGIVKGQLLNGVCTAQYQDESLNLRYLYKDEQMAFIPSISLPSNALSMAFKRRFGPSDKLSYWYNFDSNYWSTVYKHTVGNDYKFKVGYDSEVRLGWASLWVGDEDGQAKTAPMKTKIQFMLQVPKDDIKSAALMFRVKKRWDI